MRRPTRFSVILALALAPYTVHPQASTNAAPRIVNGFDANRLARIDQFLQSYVDKNEIAGAVVLVMRDGRPVYERAVGWADKESGRRMTPDTIFRIASQTKAITSVAILSLMEEGKVGLK